MRCEDARHVQPKSGALGLSGIPKLDRGGENPGDASAFKVVDVVHTARRARTSIGQRFDHRIALAGDLVAQIDGSRLGESRLAVAIHLGPQVEEL